MKLPRDISGKNAVKALRRAGFEGKPKTGGSHVRLSKGSRRVVVPMHGSIKPGTLANILRQAGLTPEEFDKLL